MEFLKLFLRGISLLPSLVQGVEALYGAKSGVQKKDAAISIVSSSINMADAVSSPESYNRGMPADSKTAPVVGVIMGSRNDFAVMSATVDVLREFGVVYE